MRKILLPGLLFFLPLVIRAQESFVLQLPDVNIYADRLLRGDADTYGLGDWRCNFNVRLDGDGLILEGNISFTEGANDFTTITGEFRQRLEVGELKHCRHCMVRLATNTGTVSGPNIGARGYRWFEGKKLIKRARIQTDTFGADIGHIGGIIRFAPLQVLVDCRLAVSMQE
ncbi:MAG: hypothetical protein SFV22_01390 [Saprospiraceae bacterium]|nr:hypothetical protein [Saprospiraceae bacterium]